MGDVHPRSCVGILLILTLVAYCESYTRKFNSTDRAYVSKQVLTWKGASPVVEFLSGKVKVSRLKNTYRFTYTSGDHEKCEATLTERYFDVFGERLLKRAQHKLKCSKTMSSQNGDNADDDHGSTTSKLTAKDIDFLLGQTRDWRGAPTVDKIVSGTLTHSELKKVYRYSYKSGPHRVCNATLTFKFIMFGGSKHPGGTGRKMKCFVMKSVERNDHHGSGTSKLTRQDFNDLLKKMMKWKELTDGMEVDKFLSGTVKDTNHQKVYDFSFVTVSQKTCKVQLIENYKVFFVKYLKSSRYRINCNSRDTDNTSDAPKDVPGRRLELKTKDYTYLIGIMKKWPDVGSHFKIISGTKEIGKKKRTFRYLFKSDLDITCNVTLVETISRVGNKKIKKATRTISCSSSQDTDHIYGSSENDGIPRKMNQTDYDFILKAMENWTDEQKPTIEIIISGTVENTASKRVYRFKYQSGIHLCDVMLTVDLKVIAGVVVSSEAKHEITCREEISPDLGSHNPGEGGEVEHRPLKPHDYTYLISSMKTWTDVPEPTKIISGNVQSYKFKEVYRFTYDAVSNRRCNVTLTQYYFMVDGVRMNGSSQHDVECISQSSSELVPSDEQPDEGEEATPVPLTPDDKKYVTKVMKKWPQAPSVSEFQSGTVQTTKLKKIYKYSYKSETDQICKVKLTETYIMVGGSKKLRNSANNINCISSETVDISSDNDDDDVPGGSTNFDKNDEAEIYEIGDWTDAPPLMKLLAGTKVLTHHATIYHVVYKSKDDRICDMTLIKPFVMVEGVKKPLKGKTTVECFSSNAFLGNTIHQGSGETPVTKSPLGEKDKEELNEREWSHVPPPSKIFKGTKTMTILETIYHFKYRSTDNTMCDMILIKPFIMIGGVKKPLRERESVKCERENNDGGSSTTEELSPEDEKYLSLIMEDWPEAPPVSDFDSGTVENSPLKRVYRYSFTSDSHQTCDVKLTETLIVVGGSKKVHKSKHRIVCSPMDSDNSNGEDDTPVISKLKQPDYDYLTVIMEDWNDAPSVENFESGTVETSPLKRIYRYSFRSGPSEICKVKLTETLTVVGGSKKVHTSKHRVKCSSLDHPETGGGTVEPGILSILDEDDETILYDSEWTDAPTPSKIIMGSKINTFQDTIYHFEYKSTDNQICDMIIIKPFFVTGGVKKSLKEKRSVKCLPFNVTSNINGSSKEIPNTPLPLENEDKRLIIDAWSDETPPEKILSGTKTTNLFETVYHFKYTTIDHKMCEMILIKPFIMIGGVKTPWRTRKSVKCEGEKTPEEDSAVEEMTPEDENNIIEIMKDWPDAPPVLEFDEGTVETSPHKRVYQFSYKSDSDETCTVTLTQTFTVVGGSEKDHKSKHRIKCIPTDNDNGEGDDAPVKSEMTPEDENKIIKIMKDWPDAPSVLEFNPGTVETSLHKRVYKFSYKSDSDETCTVTLTQTFTVNEKGHKSKHRIKCISTDTDNAEGDDTPVISELTPEDENKLTEMMEDWPKVPSVSEFLTGTVETSPGKRVYQYSYKSDSDETCTVTLTQTFTVVGGREKDHKSKHNVDCIPADNDNGEGDDTSVISELIPMEIEEIVAEMGDWKDAPPVDRIISGTKENNGPLMEIYRYTYKSNKNKKCHVVLIKKFVKKNGTKKFLTSNHKVNCEDLLRSGSEETKLNPTDVEEIVVDMEDWKDAPPVDKIISGTKQNNGPLVEIIMYKYRSDQNKTCHVVLINKFVMKKGTKKLSKTHHTVNCEDFPHIGSEVTKLNSTDIKEIVVDMEDWKDAPPVEKIISGTKENNGPLVEIFRFNFKSDQNKTCHVVLIKNFVMKKDTRKLSKSQHTVNCEDFPDNGSEVTKLNSTDIEETILQMEDWKDAPPVEKIISGTKENNGPLEEIYRYKYKSDQEKICHVVLIKKFVMKNGIKILLTSHHTVDCEGSPDDGPKIRKLNSTDIEEIVVDMEDWKDAPPVEKIISGTKENVGNLKVIFTYRYKSLPNKICHVVLVKKYTMKNGIRTYLTSKHTVECEDNPSNGPDKQIEEIDVQYLIKQLEEQQKYGKLVTVISSKRKVRGPKTTYVLIGKTTKNYICKVTVVRFEDGSKTSNVSCEMSHETTPNPKEPLTNGTEEQIKYYNELIELITAMETVSEESEVSRMFEKLIAKFEEFAMYFKTHKKLPDNHLDIIFEFLPELQKHPSLYETAVPVIRDIMKMEKNGLYEIPDMTQIEFEDDRGRRLNNFIPEIKELFEVLGNKNPNNSEYKTMELIFQIIENFHIEQGVLPFEIDDIIEQALPLLRNSSEVENVVPDIVENIIGGEDIINPSDMSDKHEVVTLPQRIKKLIEDLKNQYKRLPNKSYYESILKVLANIKRTYESSRNMLPGNAEELLPDLDFGETGYDIILDKIKEVLKRQLDVQNNPKRAQVIQGKIKKLIEMLEGSPIASSPTFLELLYIFNQSEKDINVIIRKYDIIVSVLLELRMMPNIPTKVIELLEYIIGKIKIYLGLCPCIEYEIFESPEIIILPKHASNHDHAYL